MTALFPPWIDPLINEVDAPSSSKTRFLFFRPSPGRRLAAPTRRGTDAERADAAGTRRPDNLYMQRDGTGDGEDLRGKARKKGVR